MNTITVAGNVVRDPELRFFESGSATTNFSVAVSRRKFDKAANDWTETTSFFDVVAWGKLAEGVAEAITKGERVVITGRLEQRSWTTDAGEKRSKIEIVAEEVGKSVLFAASNASPRTGANTASYSGASSEPF